METADGSCRRMVYGLNAMIFVGNIKVVWEGRSVMGVPIPIAPLCRLLLCHLLF
jgi:hypothetical protein